MSQTALAEGRYEPHLTVQLLPRCPACHAPHPLARTPPKDAAICPDCGGRAAEPGVPHEEKVEVVDQAASARLFRKDAP